MDERGHHAERPVAPAGPASPLPTTFGRRFLESHPWLVDAAVAALITVPVLLTLLARGITGRGTVQAWDVITIGLTGTALLFRRRRPLTVLAAVTALNASVAWATDSNLLLAVAFAVYSVATRYPQRVAWPSAAAAFLVGSGAFLFWLWRNDQPGSETGLGPGVVILTYALTIVIGLALGSGIRARAERERILTEQAEQLVRERDSEAQLAALAERGRIAREMHDIVAHSLSVMITLADGATATCERDPGRTRTALEALSTTGRAALRDMGQLLSVLRDPADARSAGQRPLPGVAQIAELVESYRAAGLPVRYTVTGVPVADAGRELAAYRIVQEALTNVLRYSSAPSKVDVMIDHRPPTLRITVTDDGAPIAPVADVPLGSGRGLVGMAERAAVHDGHVEAGPLLAGGWRVHAVLPYGDGDGNSDEEVQVQ